MVLLILCKLVRMSLDTDYLVARADLEGEAVEKDMTVTPGLEEELV